MSAPPRTRQLARRETRSSRTVASVATACYAAFLLGPPIMGFIADAASLRLAFGLVALVTTSVYFLAPAVRPSSQPSLPSPSSPSASHAQGTS